MELSLVTHVLSGPIGYERAGHFAWQKSGGNFKQGEIFFAPRCRIMTQRFGVGRFGPITLQGEEEEQF